MPTTEFTSIKARRLRFTTLDSCGLPLTGVGTSCHLVCSGFVAVTLAAQVENGKEFLIQNAYGDFCVNERDDSRVKGWDATIEFCSVNPEILAALTGGTTYENPPGTSIGGTFGEDVGGDFSLELWTRISGGACGAGGGWLYWALPHLRGGVLGDLKFENGPLSITVNSARSMGPGSTYAKGLYADFQLPDVIPPSQHIGYMISASTPPTDTDGCVDYVHFSTGATAGSPGTWTPPGSAAPDSPAEMIANTGMVTPSPATKWTIGQYVQTTLAGAPGKVYWDATKWVQGTSPG